MEFGKSSAQMKNRIDSVATELLTAFSCTGIDKPVLSLLCDRVWIQSFATDSPWFPMTSEEFARASGIARVIAPSVLGRLFTASDVRILDGGRAAIEPCVIAAATGACVTKKGYDERYIKCMSVILKYLTRDMLEADVSYMWAVGKARLMFSEIDQLYSSIPADAVEALGYTKNSLKLAELYDQWLLAAGAAEEAALSKSGLKVTAPLSTQLISATAVLRDAVAEVMMHILLTAHDSPEVTHVAAASRATPHIHLRSEAITEMAAVYPQVYAIEPGVKGSRNAVISKINTFGVRKVRLIPNANATSGYTVARPLAVGAICHNELFLHLDGKNRWAYPVLAAVSQADPLRNAFYAHSLNLVVNTDIAAGSSISGSDLKIGGAKSMVIPYFSTVDKQLFHWHEGLHLPRVQIRKASGLLVSTVNPSVPGTLEGSIPTKPKLNADSTTGVDFLADKPTDILCYHQSRCLMPHDIVSLKDEGSKDPVILLITGQFEVHTVCAFDFLIATPGLADSAETLKAVSLITADEEKEDTFVASPIDRVFVRQVTKAGLTRLTYISGEKQGPTAGKGGA